VHAKRRRSWWQFRLRTLFLVVTLSGMGLALLGIPLAEYSREQRIVAPIEAAGGRVGRRFVPRTGSSFLSAVLGSHPFMRVDSIENARATPIENLQGLDELRHLRSLALRNVTLPDDALKHIARIRGLESLDLSGSTVSGAGLQYLRGHEALSRLRVARTPITDAALEQLEATLPQAHNLLRQRAVDELLAAECIIEPHADPLADTFSAVHLSGKTTARDLRHLARLPGLTRLYAVNVTWTEDSIARLRELAGLQFLEVLCGEFPSGALGRLDTLTGLQSLRLQYVPVDDEDLRHVGAFGELRELCLNGTRVTGLALTHLRSLNHLERLSLKDVQRIYDLDLENLYPLQTLRTLAVPNAMITEAGLARLRDRLPELQVIAPERSRAHVAWGPPAQGDMAAQTAFWSGEYDRLRHCLESSRGRPDWSERQWLGHARELAGDWPGAIAAYKEAIGLLGDAWTASNELRERRQFAEQWPILVLLTGRAQLELLQDPAGAIETLNSGLKFAPPADRPISELAREAAKRIDGLASPHATRQGTEPLGHDLMYPLATHRHLAIAYEASGKTSSAIECWARIRLCQLAYRAAMAETDARHLARLWASLPEDEPLPDLPVFSVFQEDDQSVTLEPASGASRITCWAANAWDSYGLVPKPGHAIASLRFECASDESPAGRDAAPSCWAGAIDQHNHRSRILHCKRFDGSRRIEGKTERFEVDVPFDCDALFVSLEGLASATLCAKLRRRTGTKEAPLQDSLKPRPLLAEDVVTGASPFQCVDHQPHEPIHQRLGATALARLPGGRFLLAFGDGGIEIALSEDGETWDGPFPYPHNEIFPTRNPSLCVDDDGTAWLIYLSKRPSYDVFASGPYYVYCACSRDGRHWSQPKPIQPCRMIQYQEVPCLIRDPQGDFRLFLGDQMAVAPSPHKFAPARPLCIPVREDWTAQDVHAVFGDRGRCHIVYGDSLGRVHYSYADTDGIWRVNTRLTAVEPMHVRTPQLVLVGERLALLIWTPQGLWLHRGRLTKDGPRLGPAQQIMDSRFDASGARLLRDGDDVYLPLPARPPLLLRAKLDDLLEP